MREFDARVIAGTTPTSTGTKDFTASSAVGGAPSGLVVSCMRTDGTEDFEPHASVSTGFADGTDNACFSAWARDNVTTTVAKNQGSTNSCIRLFDPTDGSLVVEATLDSFITDGVRLDFTTVDSTAWRVVILAIFGTDVDCAVYNLPPVGDAERSSDTGLAFLPTFIIGGNCISANESDSGDLAWTNHAAIDPSAVTQGTSSIYDADAHANSRTRSLYYDERVGQPFDCVSPADSPGLPTQILGFTGDGIIGEAFDYGIDIGNSADFYGLAVRASDRIAEMAVSQSTPGSASDVEHGTVKPAFVFLMQSAANSNNSKTSFGAISVGLSDFTEEHTVAIYTKNAQSTSQVDCRYADRGIQLYTSSLSLLSEGTIDIRDEDGFTLSFDSIAGSARRYHVLAVEAQPFEASGSPQHAAMTASGTANLVLNIQLADLYHIHTPQPVSVLVETGLTTLDIEIELPATASEIETGLTTLELEIELPATASEIETGLTTLELEIELPAVDLDLDVDVTLTTLDIEVELPATASEFETGLTTLDLEIDLLNTTAQISFPTQLLELELEILPVLVEDVGGGDVELSPGTLVLEVDPTGSSIEIDFPATVVELEIFVSAASELDIPLTTLEAVIEVFPATAGGDKLIQLPLFYLRVLLGDHRIVNGSTYYFQKNRIHNKLVSLAQLGLFFPVEYSVESDLMGIDGLDTAAVAPKSIETNETLSRMGISIRNRTDGRRDRQSWTWDLFLDFQEEVALEIFEKELMLQPPLLPKDDVLGLQQVTLNLVDVGYTHPPEHEATSGTQAKLTFDAVLGPT